MRDLSNIVLSNRAAVIRANTQPRDWDRVIKQCNFDGVGLREGRFAPFDVEIEIDDDLIEYTMTTSTGIELINLKIDRLDRWNGKSFGDRFIDTVRNTFTEVVKGA